MYTAHFAPLPLPLPPIPLDKKVDRSLLTPEGARCHERLSNGEILCELAAALDYAVSGAFVLFLFLR